MKVLVINSGSSSLKYQLYDMSQEKVLAKGLCERIGIDGVLKHKAGDKEQYVVNHTMKDHNDAIKLVMDILVSKEHGVIDSVSEIEACGHRVAHGGEYFTQSAIIDDKCLEAITDCIALAPLHNPAAVMGIKACQNVMGKDVKQVAVFDTAFHQTMPEKAFFYPVPYEMYEKYKVRKYGFHGTSHRFVAQRAAAMLGKPLEELKLITCHLGNGSSIAAVDGGRCVDTTMGFTPLDGLIMGTRTGSLDPAIVTFIMEKEGYSPKEMNDFVNKRSGLLGISQLSSDLREVEEAANQGNHKAQIALDILCYQIKRYIGSYIAAMGGVDGIVFTAGIGENSATVRAKSLEGLEKLGIAIDLEKNQVRGKEVNITREGFPVQVMIIPTNEEWVIAKDTVNLVG